MSGIVVGLVIGALIISATWAAAWILADDGWPYDFGQPPPHEDEDDA